METNRAIQQVYTQAADSDSQVCLTVRQPAGFRCRKNIYMRSKGAWHLAGAYENKNTTISSEGLRAFIRKFAPTKISHYTVSFVSDWSHQDSSMQISAYPNLSPHVKGLVPVLCTRTGIRHVTLQTPCWRAWQRCGQKPGWQRNVTFVSLSSHAGTRLRLWLWSQLHSDETVGWFLSNHRTVWSRTILVVLFPFQLPVSAITIQR